MTLHIIVDGYNMIRQSSDLRRYDRFDLASGREELLRRLAEYRKVRPHRITVVFDGAGVPLPTEERDRVRGIDVRFSRGGESADTVIRRMAAREKERALVVSSDRGVSDFAAARGAAVIDSPAFEERIEIGRHAGQTEGGEPPAAGWTPTTRKKGPSRRLPKRQRRNRRKLGKL
ncbi:MAG: NYN domain-containing protein [Desulfobacterales bacterium]|jgi:predicted RNA-binding protein with PIN domain